jgi:hypothetical protein
MDGEKSFSKKKREKNLAVKIRPSLAICRR